MYLTRALEDRLLEASAQFGVVLVTGPRQVGKTTLLQHLCGAERRYVTLDDPTLRALALEDPALFLQRFPPPVLIDEIQHAPGLLPHVKMAVDTARQPGAFWLTGSQQFQVMRGVTESLAGRVAMVQLLGFSSREATGRPSQLDPFLPTAERIAERMATAAPTELHGVFEHIWKGSFPALAAGPVRDHNLFYSSYLQTYLQRDVRDLAQVGSQESFLRFLKATAARTAQLLNLSDLARDVGIAVSTASSWLSILEASFQVALLRPFHSNLTSRLIKAPKLYFLDTGLAAHLTEWTSPETLATGAMAGAMLETHVFVEILKSYWHRLQSPQLYFYRDKDGKEVDFLFVKDGALHPVEVKLGASPRRDWVRHFAALERFKERLGEGAVISLYPEQVPLTATVNAVPVGSL